MGMEVQLTPEQEAFIRQAISSARLNRAEDAIQQALSLWEKQERNRVEILAAFDEAEADPQIGQYDDYDDETLPLLADRFAELLSHHVKLLAQQPQTVLSLFYAALAATASGPAMG
jgi:Arc/MetJ-type ribon-helix-helix transcriptional regulator